MVRCYNGYTLRCSVFFCSFVKGLPDFYPELFEGESSGDLLQVNFSKKWGSYATIILLANNDVRAIEEVVKLPLSQCLLYLAYHADKGLLESMLHQKMLSSMQH